MPRRQQDPQDVREESAPYVPVVSEELAQLAREEEEAERRSADLRERRRQKERERDLKAAEKAEKDAKLNEMKADTTSELDTIFDELMGVSVLGDLRGIGARVDRVRQRYETEAIPLGDATPDQFLNRHPVMKLMSLLVMFPAER